MTTKFTQLELIRIFKSGGSEFEKAAAWLDSIVPEKITVNKKVCKHFASYFQPDSMRFAYLDITTGDFHCLTQEEITTLTKVV